MFCTRVCIVGVLTETRLALLFQADSAACFRGLQPVASQSRLVSSYSGHTQCLGRRQRGTPWTMCVTGGGVWHVKVHGKYQHITANNSGVPA